MSVFFHQAKIQIERRWDKSIVRDLYLIIISTKTTLYYIKAFKVGKTVTLM